MGRVPAGGHLGALLLTSHVPTERGHLPGADPGHGGTQSGNVSPVQGAIEQCAIVSAEFNRAMSTVLQCTLLCSRAYG